MIKKINYVGRVCRYVEGSRARIVRVVCEDAETKRNFLKGANRLKQLDGFNNIYVSLYKNLAGSGQKAQGKTKRNKD